MRYLVLLALLSACVANAEAPPPNAEDLGRLTPTKGSDDDIRPALCICTDQDGCLDGDTDGDCRCENTDNCDGQKNCDQANADGDAFGDVCDALPNIPDPEAVLAALDTRLDALEAAGTGAAITSLQADVALLTAALAELRSKYPEHFHGLLGLNGDPVGADGDLSYSLPGDP